MAEGLISFPEDVRAVTGVDRVRSLPECRPELEVKSTAQIYFSVAVVDATIIL